MHKPVLVLIVDDHPAFRAGLSAILNAQPDFRVAGEAGDVDTALSLCASLHPNVVLMDLRMPGGGGASATQVIRLRWPDIRVLIVTTYDGDEDIYRSIEAGASGYVLKDLSGGELAAAVRAVAKGETVIPPALDARRRDRARRKDISPRELDVLRHIVGGLSNKDIATALGIGDESVKTHLRDIFRKLGVAGRTQAAMEAVRHGIVHLDDPPIQ